MPLRITSGIFKGRKLELPAQATLRPTSERVREAIFSTLASFGGVDEKRILDLFSGSGVFGIESLSRGAHHVTFVERESILANFIKASAAKLSIEKQVQIRHGEAEKFLQERNISSANSKRAEDYYDVVFLDPPYDYSNYQALLGRLREFSYLSNSHTIVLEYQKARDKEIGPMLLAFDILRTKSYGDTALAYLQIRTDNTDNKI